MRIRSGTTWPVCRLIEKCSTRRWQLSLKDGFWRLVVGPPPQPEELGAALAEFRRVLGDDGVLVVATHLGDGNVCIDELLGHRISTIGGTLYRREELVEQLASAGFQIALERQRGPLPHEHSSQRIYLLAKCDVLSGPMNRLCE